MKFKKVLNGILALLITSGILLMSDLSNRKEKETSKVTKEHVSLAPEQDEEYKIGITYFGPEASFDLLLEGLIQGLDDLGYVKEKNLSVAMAHANGEIANLPLINMNMDNSDVDLVIPTSTPGIASSLKSVKKHPMVFTYTYTPLEVGVGKSYTDHLPNITGVASFPPVERTLDFILESFPDTKRIGTLYNSSEANSIKAVEVAQEHADKIGVELVKTTVVNTSEVFQAMSTLAMRNIDAVWITGDNTALQAFHAIVKVCNERKLPLIVNDIDYTKSGALAAVGIGWYQTGYKTAPFVARVLKGESPAGIPIINYVKEEVSINEELAKERGIQFPEKYISEKIVKSKEPYHFALVHYADGPGADEITRGVVDQFAKLGLLEGRDYKLDKFNAQADISTLNSIAGNLVNDKTLDLVLCSTTPVTQLFAKKITHCPLVFTAVGDPLAAGLGSSYTDHLPNLSGVSNMSNFAAVLDMLVASIPDAKRIGTLFTPGESNSVAYEAHLRKAAEKRGLELISIPANNPSEVVDAAMALTSKKLDAIAQMPDNLMIMCAPTIIKAAYKNHIPYFGFISEDVKNGAIAAVACDYYQAGVQAVDIAAEILNGKKAKDIPFKKLMDGAVSKNPDAEAYFNVHVPDSFHAKSVFTSKGEEPYKFCLVHYVDSPNSEQGEEGVRAGLKSFGWTEGEDFTLKTFNAQGDITTANSISDAVSSQEWDMVFVTSTPTTQVLSHKVKNTPITFSAVGDPVAAGLGNTMEDHMGNITGVSTMSDFEGLIKLVRDTMPEVKTLGTVFCPGEVNSVSYKEHLVESAEKYGLKVVAVAANSVTEVQDAAMSLSNQGIDVFTQISDNLTASCSTVIIKTAYDHKIPYFGFTSGQISQGAVACVARDYSDAGFQSVQMAKRVLDGEDPKDIPFSYMNTENIYINHKAEEYFNVKVPEQYVKESVKWNEN